MGKLDNLTKEDKMRMLHTVRLVDYGTPSFCSSYNEYLGNIENIKKVISSLGNDSDKKNLLKAVEDYLNGGKGEVSVLYEAPEPLLVPTYLKKRKSYAVNNFEYTFMNVWDCPYYMVADTAHIEINYVKVGKKYRRYIYCIFNNLGYKNSAFREKIEKTGKFTEDYKEELLNGMPEVIYFSKNDNHWGHLGVLVTDEGLTQNRIYFCDKYFDTYKEVLEDYYNTSDVGLDGFFFDIFGDG